MKRKIFFISAFFILSGFLAVGQVDEGFNSIDLTDFKHSKNASIEDGEVDSKTKKARGEQKVMVLKQLFLEKGNGKWYYDEDSCGLKRVKAIKMAYFEEGTKAVYCGLSLDVGVENRKTFRSVSYPVLEEVKVGDTIRLTLTLLADKKREFQPFVYTSGKLKTKQGMLKNGKYLTFLGKVPVGSKDDQDLVLTTVEIPVTEENADIAWIHIVNDEDAMNRGFIIESDYSLGNLDSEEFHKVYYGNDSYKLNTEAKKNLDLIADDPDTTTCISLRGYADPSGDKTYNMRLAKNRAKAVKDYLIKKGVDPERIVIEHVDILHNEKAKENRICTILVL